MFRNTFDRTVAVITAVLVAGGVATGVAVNRQPSLSRNGCNGLDQAFGRTPAGERARRMPDGLLEYLLEDCTTVTSHGGDPAAVEENPGLSTTNETTLQSLGAPRCVTSTTAYRIVPIYLQPSNGTDRYATQAPAMRTAFQKLDGKLTAEVQNRVGSNQFGHYYVSCLADNTIEVKKAKSVESTSTATFDRLISDLKAKGYNKTNEKYWILFDGALSTSYSGQGTIQNDSSDSSGNRNNIGPSYAFNYNNTSWSTAMHEIGHNLGAVQHDAPGSTTNWHGQGTKSDDIMYYADGSANWDDTPLCGKNTTTGTNAYDWCKDAYFSPEHRSPDGSYPGNHWNQAKSYNRWMCLSFNGCAGPAPTPTPTATSTATAPAGFATYDSALGAPKCATAAASCDSGAVLLNGRDSLSGGTEPNQPNTLDACTDGASGTFHSDESLDRLKIETIDGSTLSVGDNVKITANTWAYDLTDRLDLYYATDAAHPVWEYVTTITPGASGARSMTSTRLTLTPGASVQAIRGSWRYGGVETPCTSGDYDEADDLAFFFEGGTTPTPTPTPTATTTPTPTPSPTPSPTPTPTATSSFQASNGVDDDGDGLIDQQDPETWEDADGDGVYVYNPNDNSESVHFGAYWVTGLAGGCTVKKVGTHDHETVSSCSTHG